MCEARQATMRRFTNLLDGCVKSNVYVFEIIDYYIAQLNNIPVTVKNNCNITNRFLEEEIQEYEEEENEYL